MSEFARALDAERAVIGCAFNADPAGVLTLGDAEFLDPRLATLAAFIRDQYRRNEPYGWMEAAAKLEGRVKGSELSELAADAPAGTSMWWAGIVREEFRVRKARSTARQLLDDLENPRSYEAVDEFLSKARTGIDDVPAALSDDLPDEFPPTMADLLDREFTHDWLVPGLIERRERIVVVAGEGSGKSVLLSQIGVGMAGGCHPLTGERLGDGLRVLLIDAENSPQQTQRRFRWIGARFTRAQDGWATRISPHIRPEGIDIVSKDYPWIARECARFSPDLILLTPAYKIARGNPKDDADTLALFAVLDELRVKHDAALVIETHAGHEKDLSSGRRAFRPFGSSVWLRWPEIGLGMHRVQGTGDGDPVANPLVMDLMHWRGMREGRQWPNQLAYGRPGQLPWQPRYLERASA